MTDDQFTSLLKKYRDNLVKEIDRVKEKMLPDNEKEEVYVNRGTGRGFNIFSKNYDGDYKLLEGLLSLVNKLDNEISSLK